MAEAAAAAAAALLAAVLASWFVHPPRPPLDCSFPALLNPWRGEKGVCVGGEVSARSIPADEATLLGYYFRFLACFEPGAGKL